MNTIIFICLLSLQTQNQLPTVTPPSIKGIGYDFASHEPIAIYKNGENILLVEPHMIMFQHTFK